MYIYMKTSDEKQKKLNLALGKLINLNLNANLKENLQNLSYQKNQLEIEKKEISKKYENLIEDHERIKQELKNYKNKKNNEQARATEFSEKIDELNQETDTLLEEIDKWQM